MPPTEQELAKQLMADLDRALKHQHDPVLCELQDLVKDLRLVSGAELATFCAILQAQANWLMSHIEELRPMQQVMAENLRKLYAEQTKGAVTR